MAGCEVVPVLGPLAATELPPRTSCKHGAGDCEECGTTDRRDVGHTTIGGQGAVARLRRRGAP